ncbi:hypothetical protein N7U49_22470 [Streptomyces sp. AD2-2]|nr:hypothetical protein N7U49_22470 [Streptomyces sp. AD2-2]
MLEEVVSAFGAGVLSLETAVAMLVEAGYPIEDASQEVARIRAKAEQEAAMRIAETAAQGRRDTDTEDDQQEEKSPSGFVAA